MPFIDSLIESTLHPGLVDNSLISIVPLSPPPSLLSILQRKGVPFLFIGPLKVLWQTWNLFQVLGYRTRPARWLLVQNPPSIPTLFISFLICFLRNTHLIIDWHNYGWTILAGTKGPSHPFVRISKAYESFFGRLAPTLSITVTTAMARQLQSPPYSIRSPIFTLHDRPAATFQPIESVSERLAFLSRLEETKSQADQIMAGKTRLLVSSTSWTPDEDFSLLLDALVSYSAIRSQSQSTSKSSTPSLPPILAIITGKGPQKPHYLDLIASLTSSNKLNGITILTAWLSTSDYALLLACADLGVCLHKSSSGVDLPMKVVDMFGAGLPVAGYAGYESWPELVREGVNGRGFETSVELRAILCELFEEKGKGKGGGVGTAGAKLELLRFGTLEEGRRRWDDEWDVVVGRVLGLCD
jgi:beta-1,4-mannosyltransferase